MKDKKNLYHLLMVVAIIIPVVLSLSYAYFQAILRGNDPGVTGTSTNKFEINLVTKNNGYINATDLNLIKSENIKEESQKGYFKVVSGDNKHYVTYTLALSNLTISSNLQVDDFKWQLVKSNEIITSGTFYGVSSNSMNLATGLIISANTTEEYELRIWLEETELNQISLLGGTFSAKISLIADMNQNPIPITLRNLILSQAGGIIEIEAKGNPDFSKIAITNEKMYATEDNYGISYYFRGNVDNNWVYFNNMYWRIVRINGDGSIRMIYTGTTAPTSEQKSIMTGEGTQIGTSIFNENYDLAEYTGYMYTLGEQRGTSTSSNIKTYLENWYSNNLLTQDDKIADSLFCADRSTYSGTIQGRYLDGNGIGTNLGWFGATGRLVNSVSEAPLGTGPNLICPHKDDAFTKSDNIKGNAKLSQKVGLITADEVSVAGLAAGTANTQHYLHTNNSYWLFTPKYKDVVSAFVFYLYHTTGLHSSGTNLANGVRPVISLISEINASGTGTWNDPYIVTN